MDRESKAAGLRRAASIIERELQKPPKERECLACLARVMRREAAGLDGKAGRDAAEA